MFIQFHELAEKEMIDSRDFYDNLVWGLGKKFIIDVEFALQQIETIPFAFPLKFTEYRIALLRRFPYSIIYRVETERIIVLAVAHQKRKPFYWADRNVNRGV